MGGTVQEGTAASTVLAVGYSTVWYGQYCEYRLYCSLLVLEGEPNMAHSSTMSTGFQATSVPDFRAFIQPTPCSTMYCTVMYWTVQYCIVPYSTVLSCTVLYCVFLQYCIELLTCRSRLTLKCNQKILFYK